MSFYRGRKGKPLSRIISKVLLKNWQDWTLFPNELLGADFYAYGTYGLPSQSTFAFQLTVITKTA